MPACVTSCLVLACFATAAPVGICFLGKKKMESEKTKTKRKKHEKIHARRKEEMAITITSKAYAFVGICWWFPLMPVCLCA